MYKLNSDTDNFEKWLKVKENLEHMGFERGFKNIQLIWNAFMYKENAIKGLLLRWHSPLSDYFWFSSVGGYSSFYGLLATGDLLCRVSAI